MTFKKNDLESSTYKYGTEGIENLQVIFKSTSIIDTIALKNYVREDAELMKYFRTNEAKKVGVIVKNDPKITSLLIYEAFQYLKKAFLNYCAQYVLFLNGYLGWSEVTNYYSSFFSINGLLRIQGKAIIHVLPHTILYVFPLDFESHSFFIEKAKVKTSLKSDEFKPFSENHADIWREYYHHFSRFDYKRTRYANIYNVNEENEITWEVERRNTANYNITYPIDELENRGKALEKIDDYRSKRILKNLQPLETDPDLLFYARSGSRMELLYELINLVSNDGRLNEYFEEAKKYFIQFIDNNINDDDTFKDDIKELILEK